MAVGDLPQFNTLPEKGTSESPQISNELSTPKSTYVDILNSQNPKVDLHDKEKVNQQALTQLTSSSVSHPSYAAVLQNKNQFESNKVSTSAQNVQIEDVCFKANSEFQGKLAVVFPIQDKTVLVDKLKYVLIGKFSKGRPSWSIIKEFFADLKLNGTYYISVFDQKHIYIECSNIIDYNRIWLRLTWKVDGCPMRILKWTPQFIPGIESPIVPVWVRLEGIPLYMFEEIPLLRISNALGRPIKIDARNLNRSMRNKAIVCVELDISKPLIESYWVCFEDKETGVIKDTFEVKVFYDSLPDYCSTCSHIGHRMEDCKRKKSTYLDNVANQTNLDRNKLIKSKPPLSQKVSKTWIAVNPNSGILEKRKGIMQAEREQSFEDGVSSTKVGEVQLVAEQNTDSKDMSKKAEVCVKENADQKPSLTGASSSKISPVNAVSIEEAEAAQTYMHKELELATSLTGHMVHSNERTVETELNMQHTRIENSGTTVVADPLRTAAELISKDRFGSLNMQDDEASKASSITTKWIPKEAVKHTVLVDDSCLVSGMHQDAREGETSPMAALHKTFDISERDWTTVARKKRKGRKQSTQQSKNETNEPTKKQEFDAQKKDTIQIAKEQQIGTSIPTQQEHKNGTEKTRAEQVEDEMRDIALQRQLAQPLLNADQTKARLEQAIAQMYTKRVDAAIENAINEDLLNSIATPPASRHNLKSPQEVTVAATTSDEKSSYITKCNKGARYRLKSWTSYNYASSDWTEADTEDGCDSEGEDLSYCDELDMDFQPTSFRQMKPFSVKRRLRRY